MYSVLPNDFDAIIHLAAQIHVDRSIVNPSETFKVNVEGTLKILEFSRVNDISKILYASSSEVYGSAQYVPMDEDHPLAAKHPYGVSKVAADRLCYSYNETYDLGVDILRCFNFFGPRQKDSGYGGVIAIFLKRVLENKPPLIYGDGQQTRDYMFIVDAINAYDCVLKSDSNPGKDGINFGTGGEISINNVAKLIIEKSTTSKDKISPIHVEARPVEVSRLYADIKKARELVGFKPQITFEKGIEQMVDWYTNYKSEMWEY